MSADRWSDRLRSSMTTRDSLVCVGIDPDLTRMPAPLQATDDVESLLVRFAAGIIDATADIACAYKPNLGFFLAHGAAGIRALERIRPLIPSTTPAILDAKIGDIGTTAAAYARGVYDTMGYDAVTLSPYLGEDALVPFISRADRGVFILCKTSNPGSGDLQDLDVAGQPLYRVVADTIREWSTRHPATLGMVVGATYPEQLAAIRVACPDQPILLPGVGAQAGDLAAAVRSGVDAHGLGLVVTSSRAIIYASSGDDWMDAARAAAIDLRDAVNAIRAN